MATLICMTEGCHRERRSSTELCPDCIEKMKEENAKRVNKTQQLRRPKEEVKAEEVKPVEEDAF